MRHWKKNKKNSIMSYLLIIPRWINEDFHERFLVGSNAICASTIEEARKYLHMEIVHVHQHVTTDIVKRLIVDICPNMPNLKAPYFYNFGGAFEMHALCAKMLRTHATIQRFTPYLEDNASENAAIEALYIRALRHVHPPRMKFLCLRRYKDSLSRLLEYAKRDSPSMLEYCYEALEEK
jgi:hypothetical protein